MNQGHVHTCAWEIVQPRGRAAFLPPPLAAEVLQAYPQVNGAAYCLFAACQMPLISNPSMIVLFRGAAVLAGVNMPYKSRCDHTGLGGQD